MRFSRIVAVAVLVAVCVGLASAPSARGVSTWDEWEGTWFKLRVSQKGLTDSPRTWKRDVGRQTGYLRIEGYDGLGAVAAGPSFSAYLVLGTLDGPPTAASRDMYWQAFPLRLDILPREEGVLDFLVSSTLAVGDYSGGDGAQVAFTARVRGKEGRDGSLRQATFTTLGGCYAERGDVGSSAGSVSMQGPAVDPERLPFPWPLDN